MKSFTVTTDDRTRSDARWRPLLTRIGRTAASTAAGLALAMPGALAGAAPAGQAAAAPAPVQGGPALTPSSATVRVAASRAAAVSRHVAATPGQSSSAADDHTDEGHDPAQASAPDSATYQSDGTEQESALPQLRTFDPCYEGKLSVGSKVTTVLGPIEELLGGVRVTYQWLRDGEPISGATSKSYVLTEEDGGANIAVAITASKPGYRTEVRISCTRKISAKPEAVKPRSVRLAGKTQVGGTVKVVGPSWGKRVKMQYRWTCDHETLKVTSNPQLTLGPQFAGCRVSVAVRGYAKDKASTVRVTNHPEVDGMTMALAAPELGAVTDTGVVQATTAKAGTVLRALLVPEAAYPDFAVTWEWLSDGEVIPDATGDTYPIAWSNAGKSVSARATATATGYEPVTVTTGAIAVPEPVLPKPPPETRRPLPPRSASPSPSASS
ncbi:MAG: hypothetical protein LBK59_00950 [Bifidobacteriaceae bacterium]|jgi:hypothetical protein|nr:hypothetical protein [Bifidobacteriaceae bacterium]